MKYIQLATVRHISPGVYTSLVDQGSRSSSSIPIKYNKRIRKIPSNPIPPTPPEPIEPSEFMFEVEPYKIIVLGNLSGTTKTIDWGDGTIDTFPENVYSVSHEYTDSTPYIVKCSGVHPDNSGRLLFTNGGNDITRILNWGDLMIGITNANGLLQHTDLISIPSKWTNWGSIVTMVDTFYSCSELKSIESWTGLSSINSMRRTFKECRSITSIPSSWVDIGTVTDMYGTFDGCSLSNIPTSWEGLNNLITADYAFCGYLNSMTTLPLSWVGLDKIETLDSMFAECYSLTTIPTSWTGLSSLTNSNDMFYGTGITAIPATWVGLDSLTSCMSMFTNCTELTAIPSTWNGLGINTLIYAASMFSYCTQLTAIPSTWNGLERVTGTQNMFSDCRSLTICPPNFIGLGNVTDATSMFARSGITTVESWNGFDSLTSMVNMFSNCKSLVSIASSEFIEYDLASTTVLPSVRQVYQTFNGCTALTDNIRSMYDYLRIIRFVQSYSATGYPSYGGCYAGCTSANGYSYLVGIGSPWINVNSVV